MRNKKAFTLIELLVTMGVIGVLAAMAMANFSSYQQKANDGHAINQLLSMRTAIEAVSGDLNSSCAFTIEVDGTITPSSGTCTLSTFPAYKHKQGVYMIVIFSVSGRNKIYNLQAAHCAGSPGGTSGYAYDGKFAAYNLASNAGNKVTTSIPSGGDGYPLGLETGACP